MCFILTMDQITVCMWKVSLVVIIIWIITRQLPSPLRNILASLAVLVLRPAALLALQAVDFSRKALRTLCTLLVQHPTADRQS